MNSAAACSIVFAEQVLRLVRRLADRGLGVILISHNMNDVREVADNIAVLYLGQMVGADPRVLGEQLQVVELITAGRTGEHGLPRASLAGDTDSMAPVARRRRRSAATPEPGPTRGVRHEHLDGADHAEEIQDFGGGKYGIGGAVNDYWQRLRGGDVGSLPAVLGRGRRWSSCSPR